MAILMFCKEPANKIKEFLQFVMFFALKDPSTNPVKPLIIREKAEVLFKYTGFVVVAATKFFYALDINLMKPLGISIFLRVSSS